MSRGDSVEKMIADKMKKIEAQRKKSQHKPLYRIAMEILREEEDARQTSIDSFDYHQKILLICDKVKRVNHTYEAEIVYEDRSSRGRRNANVVWADGEIGADEASTPSIGTIYLPNQTFRALRVSGLKVIMGSHVDQESSVFIDVSEILLYNGED